MKIYYPDQLSDYALRVSQEEIMDQEDKDLGQSYIYLRENVPLIGYVSCELYAVPQIAYESVSMRDLPTPVRRPSYERKEAQVRAKMIVFLFTFGYIFALVSIYLELLFMRVKW